MKTHVVSLVAGHPQNDPSPDFKPLIPVLAQIMADLSQDSPYGQKAHQYEKHLNDCHEPETPTGTGAGIFLAYETSNKIFKKTSLQKNLLGFLTCTFVRNDRVEVDFFCVGKQFRQQGIGNILWQSCEQWAKQQQIPRIVLDVGQHNTAAMAFYKKQGFKKISTRKAYYALGENALVYEKKLDLTIDLIQKIKTIPHQPGVYLYTDATGQLLYVGKAKNLYKRVKSYFVSFDRLTAKTRALVAKITDVQVVVTHSEYESLILENNLIKEHHPPYNILLRDDKTYPYIRIDLNEDWPKPHLTRRRRPDGALYFGPYVDGSQWHQLLRFIHRFFPLVKCNRHVFHTVSRPCNYYEIKQCLGPCKLAVDRTIYMRHVNHVIDLLSGRVGRVVQKLREEIAQAATDLDFERGILLRDQLFAIEKQDVLQSIQLDVALNCDVISWAKATNTNPLWWVLHVVHVREGRVVGATPLSINLSTKTDGNCTHVSPSYSRESDILLSLLCQFYESHQPPPLIVLVEPAISEIPLASYLPSSITVCRAENFYLNIRTQFKTQLSKKAAQEQLEGLLQLAQKNAQQTLDQKVSESQKVQQELEDVREFLGLAQRPVRVECYDISTLQGSHTVGARVVFCQGVASTTDYRLYTIKNPEAQTNDFASLQEVLRRRFQSGDPLPDALILDGGEPQVREVAKLLLELGLDHLPFFGLAKARTERGFYKTEMRRTEERIVFPPRIPSGKENEGEGTLELNGVYITKTLTAGSPAFRWFTRLRDETHRRAIGFHRKRRGKESLR